MKKAKKIILWVLVAIVAIILLILSVLFVFPYCERVSARPLETSADWMKDVPDDKSLDAVAIPGTHDSATAYVELPFFMRCQSLTVEEQLNTGYRYLDIRLNEENGKLVFYHSFAKCKTGLWPWASALELEAVLEMVYSFLENHPTETVLFVVKQEGSGDVALFQQVLHAYINRNPEKWLLTDEVPTMGEARGKLVLFRRYEDREGLGVQSGIPINWKDQGGETYVENGFVAEEQDGVIFYIQDRYNYTIADKKKGMAEALLQAGEAGTAEGIRVHFASTAGPNSLNHPYLVSRQMNDWYQKQNFTGNIGWVIFDHGDAKLAERVYRLNGN